MVARIFKIIRQNIIGFILGLLFMGTGVYAATVIAASSVGYTDNSSLGATNVQDAIDKLNTKATTKIKEAEAKCPDGYKCTKLPKLCKRATTLHTEICSNEVKGKYCDGDGYTASGSMKTTTITYGNLGTTGTLTSGDAFDCDVNGDGVYDAKAERFYYVSDMTNGITTDSNTAVLIYYNNVSGGVTSNSTVYAYASSGNSNNGPVTALEQLPKKSQWKNVSLINETRNITDSVGTVIKFGFSYSGYAARLLTTQEVSVGCGFTVGSYIEGELSSKCKYLMENTYYSSQTVPPCYWLESIYDSREVYEVNVFDRNIVHNQVSSKYDEGIRPAIEVSKTNIDY